MNEQPGAKTEYEYLNHSNQAARKQFVVTRKHSYSSYLTANSKTSFN